MVVEAFLIIVEISKWLSIIKHNSLTSVNLRRAVIAYNIQDNLDIRRMTCIHQFF